MRDAIDSFQNLFFSHMGNKDMNPISLLGCQKIMKLVENEFADVCATVRLTVVHLYKRANDIFNPDSFVIVGDSADIHNI